MRIHFLKQTKILLVIWVLTLSAFHSINIWNASNNEEINIKNINFSKIIGNNQICVNNSDIKDTNDKSVCYERKIFIFKNINELDNIKDIKKEIKNRKKYHKILLNEYNIDLKNQELLENIMNNSIELSDLNEKYIILKEKYNNKKYIK